MRSGLAIDNTPCHRLIHQWATTAQSTLKFKGKRQKAKGKRQDLTPLFQGKRQDLTPLFLDPVVSFLTEPWQKMQVGPPTSQSPAQRTPLTLHKHITPLPKIAVSIYQANVSGGLWGCIGT